VHGEWAFVCVLRLLFKGNLLIIGDVIVVGAFGVIAVNAMMMALLDATASAHAGTKVGWYLTGRCSSLGMVWTKIR
jgi:hypothetical protein